MTIDSEIFCGLDIGSSQVKAVIGEVRGDQIEIVGIGEAASHGVRYGAVVNVESTTRAIRDAIHEAEQMAGCEVGEVVVAISGNNVRSIASNGQVSMRTREVTAIDVQRVMEQARAINLSTENRILHAIPLEYVIDQQGGIKEPIGMNGVRMEVHAHVVIAPSSNVENVLKCCTRAGFHPTQVVLSSLASAHAVLCPDERDLGCVVIDIGGGCTDILVFSDGAPVFATSVVLGGHNITHDLAFGLHTSLTEAESLKRKQGCALGSMVDPEELVTVPGVGPRQAREVPRQALAQIIEPRAEEILAFAYQALESAGQLQAARSGIVLTGGAATMPGLVELAEEVFGTQVRVGGALGSTAAREGEAHVVDGGYSKIFRDARYASAVGLLIHAAQEQEHDAEVTALVPTRGAHHHPHEDGARAGIMGRAMSWLSQWL